MVLYAAKHHGVHRIVYLLFLEFIVNCRSWSFIGNALFGGKFQYRVTKESLMDRLSTNVRATCCLMPENCRSVLCEFDIVSDFHIIAAELLAFQASSN